MRGSLPFLERPAVGKHLFRKVVGAVFELLWLPMMMALFVLPVLSMTAWIKRRYTVRTVYFYSLLLSFINITLFFYRAVKDV